MKLPFECIDSLTGRKWKEKFVVGWTQRAHGSRTRLCSWPSYISLRSFQPSGAAGLPAAGPGQHCVYFYSSWRVEAFILTSSALCNPHPPPPPPPNTSITHHLAGRCRCVSPHRDIWGDWCRSTRMCGNSETLPNKKKEFCGCLLLFFIRMDRAVTGSTGCTG